MPTTATVTAKVGAGAQATAIVFTNVSDISISPDLRAVSITGVVGGYILTQAFDLQGTLTFTITGNVPNLTVTISVA